MDAVHMGWALATGDFWRLWAAALVVMVISGFAGPAVIVVGPPLAAGLFYVLGRRMDGHAVEIGKVFNGFSQRFTQSFVAGLVPYGAGLLAGLLWLPVHLMLMFGTFGFAAASDGGAAHGRVAPLVMLPMFCADFGVFGLLALASLVVRLFFIFAQCAVWDHPESGWAAAKASARLVRDNLGSAIGLVALFLLIGVAGSVAGMLACCIGVYFTMPIVELWYSATVLYLYRSWTGRAAGDAAAARTA
jgi:uncharacterized membrane protein